MVNSETVDGAKWSTNALIISHYETVNRNGQQRRGGGMRSLLEPNRPDYCNSLICLGIYVSIQLAIIICNKREHYMPMDYTLYT